MKKKAINKVSKKQEGELAKRRSLTVELVNECGARCMTCGRNELWHPINGILGLSHIIPLGRGGKTGRNNCIIECQSCHSIHGETPETRPKDSIGYKLYLTQREGQDEQ